MKSGLNISFFGSSLISTFRNHAATYYRGLIRALHERGHRITFYEPDVYERQKHRDLSDPDWAKVVVYPAQESVALRSVEHARASDLVVKCGGVGVFDELLEQAVIELRGPRALIAFLDVDATATLDRVRANDADPFLKLIPQYDLILTRSGGDPVVQAYSQLGARSCVPIYNALDPRTHYPVPPQPRFEGSLGFPGNRRPDCEARVEEFFFNAAAEMPERLFLLGGNGWEDKPMPSNVCYLGHVYTHELNAFNCTPQAVLNVSRGCGYSPSTRVFEAAGAGACLITDEWEGIELFLEPGSEVLVARNAGEVVRHLQELTPHRARQIGQAAYRRVLSEHTYAHRAEQFEKVLHGISQEVTV